MPSSIAPVADAVIDKVICPALALVIDAVIVPTTVLESWLDRNCDAAEYPDKFMTESFSLSVSNLVKVAPCSIVKL
jgi:hypothetical protein